MTGFRVLGFDGSKGAQRGVADSTALVSVTLDAPARPRIEGYWEDPGTGGWEPPRDEVCNIVETCLSAPWCVGMAADPTYWADEVGHWEATYGDRLRRRRIGLTSQRRDWAWSLLHDSIEQRTFELDADGADYPLLRSHLLNLHESDLGRTPGKEHRGRSAGRVDLGAACAYAMVARLHAISAGPRSSHKPPDWPVRACGDLYSGAKPMPTNVRCALPECDTFTAAHFCTEDHLAAYKSRWPDDKRLRVRGKLVAPVNQAASERAAFQSWWRSGANV